jgi:metal-dependent hydrolase (beta-lactamase superfamily II)
LLYAKGRTKPGKIVTNAKGSTYSSQHMWGIAFDIAINDSKLLYDTATIKKVAVIAKKIGLGWGGDWTSIVDTPHFYLTKWGSTTSQLKSLYATPDVFKKTWKKKVKREKGLLLWKAKSKLTGSYLRIPNGATVEVLYTKGWYTKVRYKGKVGYVNKKFVE